MTSLMKGFEGLTETYLSKYVESNGRMIMKKSNLIEKRINNVPDIDRYTLENLKLIYNDYTQEDKILAYDDKSAILELNDDEPIIEIPNFQLIETKKDPYDFS